MQTCSVDMFIATGDTDLDIDPEPTRISLRMLLIFMRRRASAADVEPLTHIDNVRTKPCNRIHELSNYKKRNEVINYLSTEGITNCIC